MTLPPCRGHAQHCDSTAQSIAVLLWICQCCPRAAAAQLAGPSRGRIMPNEAASDAGGFSCCSSLPTPAPLSLPPSSRRSSARTAPAGPITARAAASPSGPARPPSCRAANSCRCSALRPVSPRGVVHATSSFKSPAGLHAGNLKTHHRCERFRKLLPLQRPCAVSRRAAWCRPPAASCRLLIAFPLRVTAGCRVWT